MRKEVSLLVIAAAKPMTAAIYGAAGDLIQRYESEKPLSESLYEIISAIDQDYSIAKVLYARGPGSFMGLKLSYIFLKTLAIAKDIEFLAADSFAFSGSRPILAHKNRVFVKKPDGSVTIETSENAECAISAPIKLDLSLFNDDTTPNYILNAA